eukprot:6507764-Lingulodinium_polyedra.AAC.1
MPEPRNWGIQQLAVIWGLLQSRICLAIWAPEVPLWHASSPLVGHFHQWAGWTSRSRGCGPA